MKKARNVIILVFLSFICILSGFFIGRYTARDHVFITTSSNNAQLYNTGATETGQESATQIGKININTASVEQLKMLPDIGEVLASRIVSYRTEYGLFASIEDLIHVDGIGEKRLEKLRQFITVGG